MSEHDAVDVLSIDRDVLERLSICEFDNAQIFDDGRVDCSDEERGRYRISSNVFLSNRWPDFNAGGRYFAEDRRHTFHDLERNPDRRVFLATDTIRSLEAFRERYSDRLLTFDALRSSGENAPHEEFGGPEIGDEILIDALLLSRCSFLVHGISNVAFAALCLAPSLPQLDVYRKYGDELARRFTRKRVARRLLARFARALLRSC